MELQDNYDIIQGLDAEVIAIAQEERDPTTLSHTQRFVKNDFPLVADPKRESWKVFARYGVYIVDKKGDVRSFIPGTKEARPRLDLVIAELAAVAGKPTPEVDYDNGRTAIARADASHVKLESAEAVVTARWMWSHRKVRSGLNFKLAFLPRVADGYHVYGFGEKEMSPFTVELELPQGIELAEQIEYPRPEVVVDKFLNSELSIYTGDIPLAAIELRATDALAAGPFEVRATIRYQACDESACFPPTTKVFDLQLEAIEGGRRRLPGVAGWQRW